MTFSPNAAAVFADGPPSSPFQPNKAQIRALFTQYETILNAVGVGAGSKAKATKAELFADLSYSADTTVWVYADPTSANNGIWRKVGTPGSGTFVYALPLPFSFIVATDTGEGTPNAIRATSVLPIVDGVLVILNVFEANDASPVTVQFNGGAVLTMKTSSGNDIPANAFVGGMQVAGTRSGSQFRISSDIASSAIQAASEDAAALSQEWAEGTEPGGPLTKSAREWSLVAQGAVTYNRARAEGTISGVGPYDAGVPIGSPNNIDIKVGGVIFDHDLYTIAGNTFTFLTNPGNGQPWESIVQTEVRELGAPSDGTVGTPQMQRDSITSDILGPGSVNEQHVTIGLLKRLGVIDQLVPSMYGVVGDGAADDTSALTAFLNAAVSAVPEVEAFLSSGTYRITGALPNLLNPKGRLLGRGRPTIKYDGADPITDLLKLTESGFNRFTQHIKNVEIDGGPKAQGLLLIDKVNHLVLEDIYLRNCHPGFQAMKTLFCVLGTFRNIICSYAEPFTSAPQNGLIIGSGTTSATQTIACKFEKLIMEGMAGTGVGLVNSWYNTFDGGTSEGNGGWGFDIKSFSRCNTFINVFCEVNVLGDFNVEGSNNTFINCEGMSAVTNSVLVSGDYNKFIGGRYQNFTIAGSAENTILDGVEILGTYTNAGTNTVRR